MEYPQPSDRAARPEYVGGEYEEDARDEDASVLHADQLTGGTETERRPLPSAGKWLLAVLAAVVLATGAVTVAATLGGTSAGEVTAAPDAVTTQLEVEGGGTAESSVSLAENAAVIKFDGVQASEGRVYQVWRIPLDGSAPVSAGTVEAEDISSGEPVVVEDIGMSRELAVSVEAPGGSQSPSLPFAVVVPVTGG